MLLNRGLTNVQRSHLLGRGFGDPILLLGRNDEIWKFFIPNDWSRLTRSCIYNLKGIPVLMLLPIKVDLEDVALILYDQALSVVNILGDFLQELLIALFNSRMQL